MLNWLRRRRLSDETRRKLLLTAARAEEAVIETHVTHALNLLRTLAGEVDPERGIEIYVELLGLGEPLAGAVSTRVLARLEQGEAAPTARGGRRFENIFREGRVR
ncbi:hypothetical protein BH24GEM2_BH24GEM2_13750 [soil metagenome]